MELFEDKHGPYAEVPYEGMESDLELDLKMKLRYYYEPYEARTQNHQGQPESVTIDAVECPFLSRATEIYQEKHLNKEVIEAEILGLIHEREQRAREEAL